MGAVRWGGVATLGEPAGIASLDEQLDGALGRQAAQPVEGRALRGDQSGELGGHLLVTGVECGDVGGLFEELEGGV